MVILGVDYCYLFSYGYCVCEQLLTTTGFFLSCHFGPGAGCWFLVVGGWGGVGSGGRMSDSNRKERRNVRKDTREGELRVERAGCEEEDRRYIDRER